MREEPYNPSDETLVARFKFDRDTEAFNMLHDRYRSKILNYLFRFLHNYQRAEELTQETFIRVYQKLPDFQMTGKVSSWIYTIAGNLARMALRKKKTVEITHSALFTREGEELDLLDCIPNHKKRPDRIAHAREIEIRIQKAIAEMPEKYREAFLLCAVQGLSHEEASEVLKVKVGTTWSRLHRAKMIFAEALGIRADKPLSSELTW